MSLRKNMRTKQSGFTLIEAMVAVMILSVGMIGLAYLQATGMRLNTTSYTRTQAAVLAGDLMDRMRSHGIVAASTIQDYQITDNTDTSQCNPLASNIDNELLCWASDIQRSLPQADVTVDYDSGWVTIEMAWLEPVLRDETPNDPSDDTQEQKLLWEAELMDAES